MIRNMYLLLLALVCLSGCRREPSVDAETVLAAMSQEADLVVTEVKIRKIAYYDSDATGRFVLTDPSTWRIGSRVAIVPVDIWLRYGYDLRELTLDAVRIDDERHAVEVRLPQPRVVDSGYATGVDADEAVSIATGLRDPVGHETIEMIRLEAYKEVMQQDFTEMVGREVRYNAENVLGSIVRSLGFDHVTIIE
ncbi:MAG: DUF4230 domain-containing protein [Bacteroidaceae bacterium]|nr:DUF4230 domain-containing protein [Bacteroidaceae bacterium]MBR1378206.1 DUF4230 domain-containing protein [Bacteroidaceae bacterium]